MRTAGPRSPGAGPETPRSRSPWPGAARLRRPPWATAGAIALALVVLGAVLRVVQYAWNRSLWLDEALIALNLRNRSLAEMMTPLDFTQGGPAAWLALERMSVQVVGGDGYGLRLVPLVIGLATLPAMLVLARTYLSGWPMTLAVALVAISPTLVYYSGEAKQYAGDVLASVLVLLVAARASARGVRPRDAAGLAALGAGVVWFSHPSVFVLAGVGLVLAADAGRRRARSELGLLAATFTAWGASFAAVYLTNIRDVAEVRSAATSGSGGPTSPLDVAWLTRAINGTVGFTLGLPDGAVGLAVVVAIVGVAGLALRGRRLQLGLLLAPALLVVVAGWLGLYSPGQRFTLFLAPVVIVLVAAGVGELGRLVRPQARLMPVLVAALILAEPTAVALKGLAAPQVREEMRPVVERIAANRAPGEPILMNHTAQFPFAIHGPEAGIPVVFADWDAPPAPDEDFERAIRDTGPIRVEEPDGTSMLDEARRLPAGRAWVLLASGAAEDQGPFILEELERRGRVIDRVDATDVSAWRFELGPP